MSAKFDIGKPIVIADSGLLLSAKNIQALEDKGYEYILGARLKSESSILKEEILKHEWRDGDIRNFRKSTQRLVVSYTSKRAHRDSENRRKGLERLQKRVQSGQLTKQSLNNRGYSKFLKLIGEIKVEIDMEKFEQDARWDGLKGYITNTKLAESELITHYTELWHIEKAFRMSKTDLRVRPIYHRLEGRIRAHMSIVFTAYCIYKTLGKGAEERKINPLS